MDRVTTQNRRVQEHCPCFALTHHATTRMSQRAVPQDVVDLLLCYGRTSRAAGGSRRFWFDRDAREALQCEAVEGGIRADIGRWFNVAAIVSPEARVVTVMRVSP